MSQLFASGGQNIDFKNCNSEHYYCTDKIYYESNIWESKISEKTLNPPYINMDFEYIYT